MRLRGVDFGNVLAGSGTMGFFGEGYWYHKFTKHLGGSFDNITFVAKTATLERHEGNLPLKDNFRPKELFPKCIRVSFRKGLVLNAVKLSNPGLKPLMEKGEWQKLTKPFFLSISPLNSGKKGQEGMKAMIDIIGRNLDDFSAPIGLQINRCPNIDFSGPDRDVLANLEIASELDIPVIQKVGLDTPPELIQELQGNGNCNGLCLINSVRFGSPLINWKEVWGSDISPLAKYGGGSLSGKALLPFGITKLKQARNLGFTKPISLGGGITGPEHVIIAHEAGASSISVASVAMVRFWELKKIVMMANTLVWP